MERSKRIDPKRTIAENFLDALDRYVSGAIRDAKPHDEYDDYTGLDRFDARQDLEFLLNDILTHSMDK
jgi:hypothetical protein